MRCRACNVLLEDYESLRKDKQTGEFLDLCDECLHTSNQTLFDMTEDEDDVTILHDAIDT
jgi:hypothetical protein